MSAAALLWTSFGLGNVVRSQDGSVIWGTVKDMAASDKLLSTIQDEELVQFSSRQRSSSSGAGANRSGAGSGRRLVSAATAAEVSRGGKETKKLGSDVLSFNAAKCISAYVQPDVMVSYRVP